MSITGTDIRDAVLANLELNDDATTITRFRVWETILSAQRAILRTFPIDQIDCAKRTITGDLTINVSAYQWPTDFIRLIKLWIGTSAISATNRGYEARPAQDTPYVINLDRRPDSNYPTYDIVENGFEIFPVPSESISDGFRLRYIYDLPTPSALQDSLLRDDCFDALVYKATSLSMLIDSYDIPGSQRFEQLFDKELLRFSGDNRSGYIRNNNSDT